MTAWDSWNERWAQEKEAYATVTDARVNAVLDVLAPRHEIGGRSPIFEWGHETSPTAEEMIDLARQVVAAIDGPAPVTRSQTAR